MCNRRRKGESEGILKRERKINRQDDADVLLFSSLLFSSAVCIRKGKRIEERKPVGSGGDHHQPPASVNAQFNGAGWWLVGWFKHKDDRSGRVGSVGRYLYTSQQQKQHGGEERRGEEEEEGEERYDDALKGASKDRSICKVCRERGIIV